MRLAIVGCGDIGRSLSLVAKLNRRIQIVGCADTELDRARRCASRGTKLFRDYREMAEELRPDALYVALPHDLHLDAIRLAASLGIDVLSEKPVAEGLQSGLEAVALAEEAGVKLAVNYQYRYNGACNRLIRLAQSGAFGRIHYLRCNVPWHREASYFESASWHASKARSGGGTLLTQASHALDVALCAAAYGQVSSASKMERGWRASGVIRRMRFKQAEVEDFAAATVELEGGPVIQLTSSMVSAVERSVTIELYGERANAVCRTAPVGRLRISRRKGTAASASVGPPESRFPALDVHGLHPFARSVEGFRRWVDGGPSHLCPGREALPVLAVVEAIYRSAESGKVEEVGGWYRGAEREAARRVE